MFMVTWWKCKKFDLFWYNNTNSRKRGDTDSPSFTIVRSLFWKNSSLLGPGLEEISTPTLKQKQINPIVVKKRIITLSRLLDQCCQWWSRRSSARRGTARCCSWCTSWSARAAPGRNLEGSKSRRRRRHQPPASICRSPPSGAPARSPPSRPV